MVSRAVPQVIFVTRVIKANVQPDNSHFCVSAFRLNPLSVPGTGMMETNLLFQNRVVFCNILALALLP
jgi:hypothetical protein